MSKTVFRIELPKFNAKYRQLNNNQKYFPSKSTFSIFCDMLLVNDRQFKMKTSVIVETELK